MGMRFRQFFESKDIFGFEADRPSVYADDDEQAGPIHEFNIELMMNLLSQKTVGIQESYMPHLHEIRWGNQPGAVRLKVDTGYTFYIERLGMDRLGNPRWIAKRVFQLNRRGYGGTEDGVAQELFEQIQKHGEGGVDAPVDNYRDLHDLAHHVYSKVKRTARSIFIPEGISKLQDDVYILKFGVRGQGVEAPGHMRVEQNQTMIAHDREAGTIRITNYNLESATRGGHAFAISPSDLDLYFFTSQDKDEISEVVAVHMKYY